MGGSSSSGPTFSVPSVPSLAGGNMNPFSNVKNWATNIGAGKPGSQGSGAAPMNVPNPAIDASNPLNPNNSPWSPSGTEPTIGALADPMGRDSQGNILRNQLAPGLGETDQLNRTSLGELQDLTSPTALASQSPWAKAEYGNIDRQTAAMNDAAHANMAASVQGASDAAAAHGGLTGGGSARIGAMGMMNEGNAEQGAANYNAQQKATTDANDYATKVGMLEQLPGQQLGAANYASGLQGFNTNAVMSGDQIVNNNTLTKYGQDMNNYIGSNLSNAIGNSGKSKGIGG